MYKLIITNAVSGIPLWAGVGNNEESLKTHGENWADKNGHLKNNILINTTYFQEKPQTPFPGNILVAA